MRAVWKHPAYAAVGIVYIVGSLPGWVLFLTGRLAENRNPYLLLSLPGLFLGSLFLSIGVGRLSRTKRTGTAVRVAFLALSFGFFALLFRGGVELGDERFLTAVLFCAMAASYLSLVAFVLLVMALLRRSGDSLPRQS
jgi:hypothetical protein